MYNGIGLHTPRGSGTSGYVEKSRVAVKRANETHVEAKKRVTVTSKALEDFDKRRKVELECYVLRKRLAEKKKDEAEIEKAVNELRDALLQKLNGGAPKEAKGEAAPKETTGEAAPKEAQGEAAPKETRGEAAPKEPSNDKE